MSFGNTTAEFGQAAAQWQKMWTDSWGQMTKSTVSSEGFAAASGAYMDWTLSTQKLMTEMSGQVMETLDLPRRSDLARLAAQVQSVETRLLDQEEANEDIRDLLVALNAKLDKLAAAPAPAPAAPAPVATPVAATPAVATPAPVAAAPAPAEAAPAPASTQKGAKSSHSVTPKALKKAVSQASTEVEVVKAPQPSRKPAKKGKK